LVEGSLLDVVNREEALEAEKGSWFPIRSRRIIDLILATEDKVLFSYEYVDCA
jgi:hypothetical protein